MTEKVLLCGYSVNLEPTQPDDEDGQRLMRLALGQLFMKVGNRLLSGDNPIEFGVKNEIRVEVRTDKWDKQCVLILRRITE